MTTLTKEFYPQEDAHREIRQRDWGKCHLDGDRNPPLSFNPARQWISRQPHLCRGATP